MAARVLQPGADDNHFRLYQEAERRLERLLAGPACSNSFLVTFKPVESPVLQLSVQARADMTIQQLWRSIPAELRTEVRLQVCLWSAGLRMGFDSTSVHVNNLITARLCATTARP